MATLNLSKIFLLQLVFLAFIHGHEQVLKVGFYQKTCPNVEAIVKKTVDEVISVAPTLAAPLLRMHFHDCFVRGCDGSVLLNSSTKQPEKDVFPNLSFRGFQVVDKAKYAVEEDCPGVVSCADILALVARNVTVAIKGPFWEVEIGRRDGRVSVMNEALTSLLPPFANISKLKQGFLKKGLSVKDLVVLSGGHTIGISHCSSFNNRLYNFTGKGGTDPTLDPNYIAHLKLKCKPGDQNSIVEMDPGSFKMFDEDYFTLVAKKGDFFTLIELYLIILKQKLMSNCKLLNIVIPSSKTLVNPWWIWVGLKFLLVGQVKSEKCALTLTNNPLNPIS